MARTARNYQAERSRNVIQVATGDSRDLEDHVAWIKRQVDRSLADPETILLAGKITSGTVDWVIDPRSREQIPVVEAWGRLYRAPMGALCQARDYACEVNAIWEFLVMNVRYVADPDGNDTFRTLKLALESGSGDCDDATISFAALLKAIGFKVSARVIATPGSQHWEHIYPMVALPKDDPKGFLPLDITVPGAEPGWQYGNIGKARDFWM